MRFKTKVACTLILILTFIPLNIYALQDEVPSSTTTYGEIQTLPYEVISSSDKEKAPQKISFSNNNVTEESFQSWIDYGNEGDMIRPWTGETKTGSLTNAGTKSNPIVVRPGDEFVLAVDAKLVKSSRNPDNFLGVSGYNCYYEYDKNLFQGEGYYTHPMIRGISTWGSSSESSRMSTDNIGKSYFTEIESLVNNMENPYEESDNMIFAVIAQETALGLKYAINDEIDWNYGLRMTVNSNASLSANGVQASISFSNTIGVVGSSLRFKDIVNGEDTSFVAASFSGSDANAKGTDLHILILAKGAEIPQDETTETSKDAKPFAAFINGFDDGSFKGADTMTREQFINILYKLKSDMSKADAASPSFKDVATTKWSYDAVEWAKAQGIVSANAQGNFRPSDMLTRAEMASMLVNAEGFTENAPNTFSDLKDVEVTADVLKAVQAGIFTGYPDGTFKPDEGTTRSEAVVALVRYLVGEPTDAMIEAKTISFNDIAASNWAYKYIVLAVNGYSTSSSSAN